jgi:hypothetical protein
MRRGILCQAVAAENANGPLVEQKPGTRESIQATLTLQLAKSGNAFRAMIFYVLLYDYIACY